MEKKRDDEEKGAEPLEVRDDTETPAEVEEVAELEPAENPPTEEPEEERVDEQWKTLNENLTAIRQGQEAQAQQSQNLSDRLATLEAKQAAQESAPLEEPGELNIEIPAEETPEEEPPPTQKKTRRERQRANRRRTVNLSRKRE